MCPPKGWVECAATMDSQLSQGSMFSLPSIFPSEHGAGLDGRCASRGRGGAACRALALAPDPARRLRAFAHSLGLYADGLPAAGAKRSAAAAGIVLDDDSGDDSGDGGEGEEGDGGGGLSDERSPSTHAAAEALASAARGMRRSGTLDPSGGGGGGGGGGSIMLGRSSTGASLSDTSREAVAAVGRRVACACVLRICFAWQCVSPCR